MNLKSRIPFSVWLSAATFLLGFFLGGCASAPAGGPNPAFVQKLIDAAGLAPDFRGTVTLNEHANAPGGVGLDVTLTDLRRENNVWVWGGLTWSRHGVWTSGTLTITPQPKPGASETVKP